MIVIAECQFKCHIWLETFSDFPDLVIFLIFLFHLLVCLYKPIYIV